MDTREIIAALGGRQKVASATGLSKNSVFFWFKRGIPSRHVGALLGLAQDAGRSDITLDILLRNSFDKRGVDEGYPDAAD